jgi:predicted Zn-dependent protease
MRQARGALIGAAALLAFIAPAQAQSGGFIRDAEIETTLRDFSTPLWKAAGLKPNDITIILVNDPTLNAFVAEGQNIFINTGTIIAADNPGQLKGVIAHETGHIAGAHLARSDAAISRAMVPAFVSIGLGVLAMAAGAGDAGAALIAGSQQFAYGSFARFSQVQESSADQAGLSFLEQSGQSGIGLLQFFEKFRYEEVMSDARRSPYFRTHPLSSDRIEALRARVMRSTHQTATDTPEDIQRFNMMKAKLYGFIETPQRTLVKYPETDTTMPARYARAVAAYRVPDTGKALKEVTALAAADPSNPYFQELWGQILFESGKAKDAVPHDRESVRLMPNNSLLLTNLGRSLNGVGDQASANEAINVLQKAVALESDNGYAWRELAAAYDTTNNEGMARLATAEQAFALGDYSRALSFAQRARQVLPQGQASWRRAADIVAIAESKSTRRRAE